MSFRERVGHPLLHARGARVRAFQFSRQICDVFLTICEEERRSWTFTRDNRWRPPHISNIEEDTNDVMFTEDGSDESGEIDNNEGSNKRQRTGK